MRDFFVLWCNFFKNVAIGTISFGFCNNIMPILFYSEHLIKIHEKTIFTDLF